MHVLVTGAGGMLGTDLCDRLAADHRVRATDRHELDVTNPELVAAAVVGVDAVINCAAWTAVDAAEEREADAFVLNAVAPHLLARAATAAGARMVQISTDYVFDGTAEHPYPEDAPVRPASAYGRTKAAGEWAVRASGGEHLVVRTAWLYGEHGPSFPRTMARLAAERETLAVVTDQVGQPTWTCDVADLVVRLLEQQAPAGTYHATSRGSASKFDQARAVLAAAGQDPAKITATTSAAFPLPAPRPAYSVLGHDALERLGIEPIGDWRERWDVAAPSVLGLRAG